MSISSPSSGLGRFFSELRRRHVFKGALAYGAVGFVLLQMAEIALPAFLPGARADASLRVLVVAFLLLFPVIVAMAWVYEMTPQGLRAMTDLDVEAGRRPIARVLPRIAFLGFTVMVAGGTGLWWYRTDAATLESSGADIIGRSAPFVAASTTDASGPIRSLAVLPLQDFSPDGEKEAYFAAGLHEALISQLGQLGTVRVISRTSVEGYAREGKSMPQIGSELGVDVVVEGSVLRADGRVRITAQLVHAASDTHLWARDYERDLEDVITLQREVAEAIAGEIGARVGEVGEEETPAELGRVTDAGTSAPPASHDLHDAVFRGRFALTGPAPDGGEDEAERHFLEALAIDSTFAPALTGLAGAHLLRGLEAPDETALAELRRARTLASQAVRRDPGSVEAREVLTSVNEALVELGARLGPAGMERIEVGTHVVHLDADSMMLVTDGDTTRLGTPSQPFGSATEIGRFVQAAMARPPGQIGSPSDELRSIRRLEAAGRHGTALTRAESALERHPREAGLWDAAERLSASTGDWSGVVRLRRERAASDIPSPGPSVEALERRLQQDGAAGYWAWKLEELDARESAGIPVSAVDRAAARVALGDTEDALTLLDEARGKRDPRLASLRTDPVWDPLRPDRRFQALLRALTLD